MSAVFILGMTMTIVGLICSWNEKTSPTATQIMFLLGSGILFGLALENVFEA